MKLKLKVPQKLYSRFKYLIRLVYFLTYFSLFVKYKLDVALTFLDLYHLLFALETIAVSSIIIHTVQEWLEIKIYCLWLFSTFHIHTWWGQAKYVRKFEISRANFEKNQNLYILKNFLWILCINMQNYSNFKELRHK